MTTWHVADAMTGQILDELEPADWSVTDPIIGAAEASLTIEIPDADERLNRLRQILVPDLVQLVLEDDSGTFPFGGPMWADPTEDLGEGTLTLTAHDWRGWFYDQHLRPSNVDTNAWDGDYLRRNYEQGNAYVDLAKLALDTVGAPRMVVDPPQDTGVHRDFTLRQFQNIGEFLDSLSRRERGMEWWTEMERTTDPRVVVPRFRTASPERSSRDSTIALTFDSDGGNLSSFTWPSANPRARRVIALGDGEPPDAVYAVDDDPALEETETLMRERKIGPLTGVSKRATAFEHAFAAREVYGAATTGSLTATTSIDDPPVDSYSVGDRAYVRVVTRWRDVELPACRIIARRITGGAAGQQATLTLAVSDAELVPGDDEEG